MGRGFALFWGLSSCKFQIVTPPLVRDWLNLHFWSQRLLAAAKDWSMTVRLTQLGKKKTPLP